MNATQIVLIVFIVLLIIIYPILISHRNRKENQRVQEQTNSLKRGDKVLTTSGVYGTIVDLHLEEDKKIVTIETGSGNKKGYIAVDAYAIYTVFKDEEQVKAEEEKSQAAAASSAQPETAEQTAAMTTTPLNDQPAQDEQKSSGNDKKSNKKSK